MTRLDLTLSRRRFLAGLGASAGAAALSPLWAPAARAQTGAAPVRLVLIPMLNGAQSFFPRDPAGLSVVTEPLAPFRSRLQFLDGIGIAGSSNHYAVRSMFSGTPISSYDVPDPTRPSVDQVIADHIQHTAPTVQRSVHLGVVPADAPAFYQLYGRSTFFFRGDRAVDYEANPVWAHDALFGMTTGGPPDPTTGADAARAAALAYATTELNRFAPRVAHLDIEQQKLNVHQDALRALAGNTSSTPAAPVDCGAGGIASVEALRGTMASRIDPAYDHANFSAVFDAQIDILAKALTCGLTRVATLQAGSADGNVTVPIEGGLPHHNTSHGDQAQFSRVQAWYAGKVARLAAALDIPDPLDPAGGTVLDNSVIVWLAETMPSSHGSTHVPCLYLGGAGGRLVTGGTTRVTGASNLHLMRTLTRVFGVPDTNATHFADAPLAEVLV